MKKYQQLILVILSILSLVSLLFYRHEYNKLRYVLEVLNFFGTPGVSTLPPCLQNATLDKYFMAEPLPAWQRVSNTLYVYSAFWERTEEKGQVKATAIGVLNENLSYGCYLWYAEYDDPVKGQFSFSGIARKSQKLLSKNSISSKYFGKSTKTKGFTFYCEAGNNRLIPFGVTFYKTNSDDTLQAFLQVGVINTNLPASNSTVMCVIPGDQQFLKQSQYLEFLAFHKVLNVNHFILYGSAFQHNLVTALLRNPSYNLDLTLMQWNYPFVGDFDLTSVIAETDCILRARGHFENIIIINWNQFLVPKYYPNINVNSIVNDFDSDKKISKFLFPTILFCLEYNDDPKSDPNLPLVFRKTRFGYLKTDMPVTLHRPHLADGTVQKVNKEIAMVNWYTKCDMFDMKLPDKNKGNKYDHSILRFNSEFMQSKILKLASYS